MGRKPTGKPRGRPAKDADSRVVPRRITLTPEADEALNLVAGEEHDGNRSAAVAHLALARAKRLEKRAGQ